MTSLKHYKSNLIPIPNSWLVDRTYSSPGKMNRWNRTLQTSNSGKSLNVSGNAAFLLTKSPSLTIDERVNEY